MNLAASLRIALIALRVNALRSALAMLGVVIGVASVIVLVSISEGTKQAALIAMLRAPGGATIAEIVAATGWQPHTVRGAMAGALKKKLGLEVASEKIDGRGRVYSLPSA